MFPIIFGLEMIFRDEKIFPQIALNIISNTAIGTFRDVPSFKSHHPYNVSL